MTHRREENPSLTMNNDAFRALVNQSVSGEGSSSTKKSTKEIAREAVEQEISQKARKKQQKQKYTEDEEEEEEDERGKKRYRDRATERRKGLNLDYKEDVEVKKVKKEMTKYLGGDEEHTHLVKGLDYALAESVRRGMKNDEQQQQDHTRHDIPKRRIVNIDTWISHSDLGQSVLLFLTKKKMQMKSSSMIHQTTFLFNVEGNVHDLKNAWEIPATRIISSSQSDNMLFQRMTPLDDNVLDRIKAVTQCNTREEVQKRTKKETKHQQQQQLFSEETKKQKGEVSDDNDDIFEDAGCDYYVAPVSEANKPTSSVTKKVAIFTELSEQAHPQENVRTQVPPAVISATATTTTTGKQGLSMSYYDGLYGEEMDVDFDGAEAEYSYETKKKHKKK